MISEMVWLLELDAMIVSSGASSSSCATTLRFRSIFSGTHLPYQTTSCESHNYTHLDD